VRVEDENGRHWQVRGGDPGSKVVNQLTRTLPGLDWIVIPCYTLSVGIVVAPAVTPADVLRRVRLADCLALVRET
jgi:hypothetical protein